MTVDGLVYRVDPAATQYWPSAFQCGDYRNVDVTIRNGSIHAGGIFGGCTDPLGVFRISNVDADHAGACLFVRDAGNAGHRRGSPRVGRHDGAAEQSHSRVARTAAADD